jgi:chemotaxis protein methyltransferase CheR
MSSAHTSPSVFPGTGSSSSRAGSLPTRTPTASVGADRESITPADFDFLRELVLRRSAIVLDDGKGYLVESRVAGIVRDEGIGSIPELVDRLRRLPRSPLETRVVDAMTTNETSFFRDVHPFDALPAILTDRGDTGPITIWCAAASSGQEPLSIAMTLHEKAPALAARTRIIATDLSPSMVERCRSARFSQLEVNRGLPARYLVKYFDQDGTEWVAKPQLRSMIDVRQMNLAEPFVGMARCDLVMLRNVLIYFSVPTKQQILGRIRTDLLKPSGAVMLGSSETTLNIDDAYERLVVGASSVYRRRVGS